MATAACWLAEALGANGDGGTSTAKPHRLQSLKVLDSVDFKGANNAQVPKIHVSAWMVEKHGKKKRLKEATGCTSANQGLAEPLLLLQRQLLLMRQAQLPTLKRSWELGRQELRSGQILQQG